MLKFGNALPIRFFDLKNRDQDTKIIILNAIIHKLWL